MKIQIGPKGQKTMKIQIRPILMKFIPHLLIIHKKYFLQLLLLSKGAQKGAKTHMKIQIYTSNFDEIETMCITYILSMGDFQNFNSFSGRKERGGQKTPLKI